MTYFLSDLKNKDPGWELMVLGHGYIDMARILAKELGNGHRKNRLYSIYHALPCLNLIHQGTENFFKGALAYKKIKYKKTHSLVELVAFYNENISTEYFANTSVLQPIYDLEAKVNTSHKNVHGQGFRYLMDKDNNILWDGLSISTDYISKCCIEMKVLFDVIQTKFVMEKADLEKQRFLYKPIWMLNKTYKKILAPKYNRF